MDEIQPQTQPQDVTQLPADTVAGEQELSLEPWFWRDLFLFLGFVLVSFFVALALVHRGYFILQPRMHWRLLSNQELLTNTFFLLSWQTISYGLMFASVYVLVAVGHAQPFWAMLRWRRITARRILACLVGGTVLTLAIALLPPILPDTNQFPLENMFNSKAAAYAIGLFAILVAPFMEELVFRGVLFGIFESQVGLRFAIVITAILFGGLHMPEYRGAWNHMLLIFFVGLVFSLARGRSGSLAPSVFLHVGYNGSMMLALFLSTQHFRNLNAFLSR